MNRKRSDMVEYAICMTVVVIMLAGILWAMHWVFSQVPGIILAFLIMAGLAVHLFVGLCGLLAALLSR